MERQDLIDVIAEGIQDAIDIDTGPQQWAVGAIRALEAAGYKIARRQATDEQRIAGGRGAQEYYSRPGWSSDFPNNLLAVYDDVWAGMFDTAPTYGEDHALPLPEEAAD